MKAEKLLTMILMLLAFTISSTDAEAKNKASIERGMTKQQVTAILGTPDNTSFDQYGEEWEYYAFRSKCSQFLALRVKRKLFTI